MARSKPTKKAAARISKKSEARIVELSLRNPDLGARRLVSLLEQEKIRASSSRIYGILKRHDLQTREKRLAKLAQHPPEKTESAPGKPSAAKIADEPAEQIVAASMQNPDFGARRLVSVLKEKGIPVSASTVYAVLKRNGLQNREARQARLKIKAAEKRPVQKKLPLIAISPAVEERVVEMSLHNPDFGAKRLLPLLQESGIDASTTRVYSILKRRGLQTRKLRLAKLAEMRSRKDAPGPDKAPSELTPEIEERIVEVALQNPDHGARRLAGLLAGEGISISSSAIYSLLKRHGLQTRDLRESRIELQRLTEDSPPEVETAAPYAVPLPTTPEEPEEAAADTVDVAKAPPAAPLPAVPVKSPRRTRWFFYLADLLLLALVGYLGYLGYHTVLNFKQSRLQPEAVAAVKSEPAQSAMQPQIAVEPIIGYRKIWERNLFNISDKTPAAAKTEIPIEKIALAQKSIGLKLVGTVVANDAHLSRAIVHVSKTREQDAYREGDQAGEAKIKKILRNKVIITTDKGDQLLTIEEEDFGKSGRAGSNQRRAPMSLASPQPAAGAQISGNTPRRIRTVSVSLNRDEVAASLADTDRLLQELKVSPFVQGDEPAGFIISNIPRGSVLTKMGLRNGYVVTQLNDQAITSPDQAAEFFRTLANGGEVSIQIRRSRGVRRRSRQINLNIE